MDPFMIYSLGARGSVPFGLPMLSILSLPTVGPYVKSSWNPLLDLSDSRLGFRAFVKKSTVDYIIK
jgi:hypothetical protein